MEVNGRELSADEEALVREFYKRVSSRKFYSIEPYPWQRRFYSAGKDYVQRALRAANRVGKTFGASYEVVCHLLGEYPEWWDGWAVNYPIDAWASSLTHETSRDIIQKELLGPPGMWGTGMIPGDKILNISKRQVGLSDVADTVTIKGKFGESTVQFKVAEQGWKKYQGTAKHLIWQDEEPDDMKVYTECMTRLATTNGRYIFSYTPLMGQTPLSQKFTSGGYGMFLLNATWDDAPHLDENTRKALLASYPEHEIEARTMGVPAMGHGAVFTTPDKDLVCDPFEIPAHFTRIVGHDFGFNHPAATVWLAHDRDTDIVYVYDCYKKEKELSSFHASKIRKGGDWIPVAWPHDGMKSGPRDGIQLKEGYISEHVNMLPISARYQDDKGGAQAVEPIVLDVHDRMKTGRLKVFRHLSQWFEEKRNYHRDEKTMKIVDRNDDLMKATFYGIMMLRYAIPQYIPQVRTSGSPVFSTRA